MVIAAVELLRVRLQAADHVAEIASRALADCETLRGTLSAALPRGTDAGEWSPPQSGACMPLNNNILDARNGGVLQQRDC